MNLCHKFDRQDCCHIIEITQHFVFKFEWTSHFETKLVAAAVTRMSACASFLAPFVPCAMSCVEGLCLRGLVNFGLCLLCVG